MQSAYRCEKGKREVTVVEANLGMEMSWTMRRPQRDSRRSALQDLVTTVESFISVVR